MIKKWFLALPMCLGFFIGFIINRLFNKHLSNEEHFAVFVGQVMGVVCFCAIYQGE